MNILDETRIGNDIYRYTTLEEQELILIALDHDGEEVFDSDAGLIILSHNDDHCGECWTEIQIIDKEVINL